VAALALGSRFQGSTRSFLRSGCRVARGGPRLLRPPSKERASLAPARRVAGTGFGYSSPRVGTHGRQMAPTLMHIRADYPSGDGVERGTSTTGGLLDAINAATKWVVSGAAFAVLLWRHDASICWCIVGSFVAVVNCKILKVAINESRPVGARKADPGMPSSHASSLGFLSGSAAIFLSAAGGAPAAGAVLALGAFLSWLRIANGFHTTAQVVCGYILGLGSAAAWNYLGEAYALEAIGEGPALMGLYALTGLMVLLFSAYEIRGELKARKKR